MKKTIFKNLIISKNSIILKKSIFINKLNAIFYYRTKNIIFYIDKFLNLNIVFIKKRKNILKRNWTKLNLFTNFSYIYELENFILFESEDQGYLIIDNKNFKKVEFIEVKNDDIITDFEENEEHNLIYLQLNNEKYFIYYLKNIEKINFKGLNDSEEYIKRIKFEDKFIVIKLNEFINIYDIKSFKKIKNFKLKNIKMKYFQIFKNLLLINKEYLFNKNNYEQIYLKNKINYISNFADYGNYLSIKDDNNNILFYDNKNFKIIKFKDLKVNDKITYFRFKYFNYLYKFIVIGLNKQVNNLLLYNKNNYNKINLDKNFNDLSIEFVNEDYNFIILYFINNDRLFLENKNFEIFKIKSLKKEDIIYDIINFKNVNKFDNSLGDLIYHNKTFKKFKLKSLNINDKINDFEEWNNFISLKINNKINFYDTKFYNEFKFNGIKNNENIDRIEEYEDFIWIKLKNNKNLFYDLNKNNQIIKLKYYF